MAEEQGSVQTPMSVSGKVQASIFHLLIQINLIYNILQVAQIGRTGPQATELDEMLGIQEQLVHAAHLIDRDTAWSAEQVIEVLKSVLRAIADMMEAEIFATIPVDNRFEEARYLREHESVEHGSFRAGQGDIGQWDTFGRHLNNDDIVVALPGLFFREANPTDLIGGVQEIGIIRPVQLDFLAHDVAGGGHPALARFEHLHRRSDQITDSIGMGNTGAHMLIDQNFALFANRDAQHLLEVIGARSLARGEKDEITWQRLLFPAPHVANDDRLNVSLAVSFDLYWLVSLDDLYASLAHPIHDVATQVIIDMMEAGGAHERLARHNGGRTARRLEE